MLLDNELSRFPEVNRRFAAQEFAEQFLSLEELSERHRFREVCQKLHEIRELLFPKPHGLDSLDDNELRKKLAVELAVEFCPEGAVADDKWRRIWKQLIATGRDSGD